MGSLDKRIADLEGRMPPPEDPGAELRQAIRREILQELGRLKGCRAQGYRGQGPGKPPRAIQPTDPAGDALGYPYTHGELMEFVVRRVFERSDLPPEETEILIASWVGGLREHAVFGERWDEVAADGPPEPAPPWRGGF